VLYSRIDPRELLHLAWTKENKPEIAPGVCTLTEHFNAMSHWVSTEILYEEAVKQRAAMLQRFVQTAEQLKQLKDMLGFMQVVAGLRHSSVQRLADTWALLPSRTMEIWEQQKELSQSNQRQYMEAITPPALPHVAVFLTELVYIEEANPTFLRDDCSPKLVNFSKLRRISEVVSKLMLYHEKPFQFESIGSVQDFLGSLYKKKKFSDDDLLEISQMREAKKKSLPPQQQPQQPQ